MPISTRRLPLIAAAALATLALGACETNPFKKDGGSATSSSSSSSTASASTTSSGTKAGMNANGEVVDSSAVESGSGRQVKGQGGWEGEITGKSWPGAKFDKLAIGMPMKQVTDLIGQPSDQGAYVTGKAWIPFYFGSDRHRYEMVYQNQGRLIFAGGSMGDWGSGHLIWIIYSRNEPAYRQ